MIPRERLTSKDSSCALYRYWGFFLVKLVYCLLSLVAIAGCLFGLPDLEEKNHMMKVL